MKLYLILASLFFVQLSFAQESSTKTWSLKECIGYAIEHNFTVKEATLDKNLAEVDYSKAKHPKQRQKKVMN